MFGWLRPPPSPSPEEAHRFRDEVFKEAEQLSFAELTALAPSMGAYPIPALRRERPFGRWRFVTGAMIWREKGGGIQLAVDVQAHGGFLGLWWSYHPRVITFTPSGASREMTLDEVISSGFRD